jgi:hypothetical protein
MLRPIARLLLVAQQARAEIYADHALAAFADRKHSSYLPGPWRRRLMPPAHGAARLP